MNYAEKLKDPRWQKKRLKILERDDFECQICRNDKETLNVHHLLYIKGREPWEYKDSSLVTLCQTCHNLIKDVDFDGLLTEHILCYGFDSHAYIAVTKLEVGPAMTCFEIYNSDYKSILEAGLDYDKRVEYENKQSERKECHGKKR